MSEGKTQIGTERDGRSDFRKYSLIVELYIDKKYLTEKKNRRIKNEK